MERIIKYEDGERLHIPRGSIVETVDLDLGERNIERDMASLVLRLHENVDPEGWALFSRLTEGYDRQTTIYTLLCLLHLVQEGSADMRQDKMYGEVFIRLLEGRKKEVPKDSEEPEEKDDN